MPPSDHQLLQETYRLTQENNRMLHKMRRSAFWGRLLTILFYIALLAAPIWFYLTYLNGAVQNILQDAQKVEGTTEQAQSQFTTLENDWKSFEARFGFATTTQE